MRRRTQDILLGFAAGVTLAASAFSLIEPGIQAATARFGGPLLGAGAAAAGLMLGATTLWAVHKHLPHEHFLKGPENVSASQLRRIWLFILAITLHNFPEGLAIGVAFGTAEVRNGLATTAGVFLQNPPEGLAVAVAVLPLRLGRGRALGLALATGAMESVGGLVGSMAVTLAAAALPWGLTAAAGAMLFVISHEIVPEPHRKGHDTAATFGVLAGFAVMMVLDVALRNA